MERAFRGALPVFLILLGAPTILEAVFVRETPYEIVQMRGMIPAIITCLLGIPLLRYVPASPGVSGAGEVVTASRPSAWVILFAYILFVYATIPFGFEVVSWIVRRIGIRAFRRTVNSLGAAAGLLFTWYVFRQRRLQTWSISLRLAMIYAIYLYFFAVLEVPVKRIHFLEFSLLSALTFRALRPFTGPPAIYLWVTLAAMVVGIGDEGIALFFPRRFAAVSDVIWDTTAGVLGALVLKFILLKR
jgi:hypothetical protein